MSFYIKLAFSFLTFVVLMLPVCVNATNDIPDHKIFLSNDSDCNPYVTTGGNDSCLIKILALDSSDMPVPGICIRFILQNTETGAMLRADSAVTGRDGRAVVWLISGNNSGKAIVIASSVGGNQPVVSQVENRSKHWLLYLIFGILGGISIFLFGVNILSEGMQNALGGKLRNGLASLTRNRLSGIGTGAFFTTIIQSSSAVSVMLASFVHSRVITFKQSVPVMIGAALGTTITIQLVVLKLTDYSLLLVALGFILYFAFRKQLLKNTGQAILGLGLLYLGLMLMSDSMVPLRNWNPLIDALRSLENPVAGILAGLVFTAITQSASAFLGILVMLASQGFISLEAGIPLMIGANVGTSVTPLIAAVHLGNDGRKVAWVHTFYRIIGVLIIIGWIPAFAELVRSFSPEGYLAQVAPRQIANSHTFFYLGMTLLSLVFMPALINFTEWLIGKKRQQEDDEMTFLYLDDNLTETPAMAMKAANLEIVRMGRHVQDMLSDIILPFLTKEKLVLPDIEKKEAIVNFMHEGINSYLLQVSRKGTDSDSRKEAFRMMLISNELEQIADIVYTNLMPRAVAWVQEKEVNFSVDGKKELVDYHTRAQKQLSRAIDVIRDLNLEKAKAMKKKSREYSNIAIDLEKSHFERLQSGIAESVASSKVHIEMIGMLNAISRHATNIARAVLREK